MVLHGSFTSHSTRQRAGLSVAVLIVWQSRKSPGLFKEARSLTRAGFCFIYQGKISRSDRARALSFALYIRSTFGQCCVGCKAERTRYFDITDLRFVALEKPQPIDQSAVCHGRTRQWKPL